MADCYTGFACSINDLEKKEQEEIKKDISILKAYIRQKNSKKTIEIINKSNKYEDFFLFNSIFL